MAVPVEVLVHVGRFPANRDYLLLSGTGVTRVSKNRMEPLLVGTW